MKEAQYKILDNGKVKRVGLIPIEILDALRNSGYSVEIEGKEVVFKQELGEFDKKLKKALDFNPKKK